jgi:hypothetical protein
VALTPLTPEWWTDRLYRRLRARQKDVARYTAYYDGDAPYPWLPAQAREEFRRVLKMCRSNYMGLVVDATSERIEVQGFRIDGKIDDDAWALWQRSNMDRYAQQGVHEAVKVGRAFVLASPGPRGPRITVEHPTQAIVDYTPGDLTERGAGLKVWFDDTENLTKATLYLPEAIYKWEGPRGSAPARWGERRVEREDWPAENPMGVVPLIELPNNPDLFGEGRSEIHDVTDVQDRINKTIIDRLMTQDFGAFPQKWATGWPDDETPADDPDAAPVDDEEPPIDIGRDRLIIARGAGSEETKFGQFDAAPLDPYSMAKQEDVKDIAARTRTPSQYLLGEMVNISAEALKAAESGLVAKVLQRREPFGDAFEEAVRLCFRLDRDSRADATTMETVWRNPEFRTEGQLMDALSKARQTLNVPLEALWERWGATPTEIGRWKEMLAEEASLDVINSLVKLADEPPAGGEPPTGAN